MSAPFQLRVGDTGPVQQQPVSCGAACLTVARMLVDPVFASWVRTGEPRLPGALPGDSASERFAAYERVVMRRTNTLWPGGRALALPWPRLLGTPPWGARRELEHGAARPGSRYALAVAPRDARALAAVHDRLAAVVRDGRPALLYVGNRRLPRHVVLVLPGHADSVLEVYDPGDGRVRPLRRDALAQRRLALSGWDVPWLTVEPVGLTTVQAFGFATGMSSTSSAPSVSPSA